MHEDNNNDSLAPMMWMMAICCGVPLLFILLGGSVNGTLRWVFMGVAVIFMIWHFRKMQKGNCHSGAGKSQAPAQVIPPENIKTDQKF